jgi:hypothetical protein
MVRIVLINILLLFSLELSASSCPSIRLDSSNHSMEHVKVTSQDGLGVCYAYAATQMLDAVFDTEDRILNGKVDKSTSSSLFSAVVALDHYNNGGNVVLRDNGNYRFPFEGGQICDSFNFIKRMLSVFWAYKRNYSFTIDRKVVVVFAIFPLKVKAHNITFIKVHAFNLLSCKRVVCSCHNCVVCLFVGTNI